MPRIRTIKPEFWGDEKMAPLSPLTRLVFLGLISMADDRGRLMDNIKRIDAFIFPETSETSRGSIIELSAIGRIRRGLTASGQRIIEITNWHHQKIEKPNYLGSLPDIVQELTEDSPTNRGNVGEASGKDRGGVGDVSVSVSVPATGISDQERAAPRKRSAPKFEAKFAAFPMALSDAGYQTWLAKLGAVDYGAFRKAFGPIFNIPEADRPASLPRDAEFARIIELYAVAIRGTKAAQFVAPAKCAAAATGLTAAAREANAERRLMLARSACGTVEEQRRLEGMAA